MLRLSLLGCGSLLAAAALGACGNGSDSSEGSSTSSGGTPFMLGGSGTPQSVGGSSRTSINNNNSGSKSNTGGSGAIFGSSGGTRSSTGSAGSAGSAGKVNFGNAGRNSVNEGGADDGGADDGGANDGGAHVSTGGTHAAAGGATGSAGHPSASGGAGSRGMQSGAGGQAAAGSGTAGANANAGASASAGASGTATGSEPLIREASPTSDSASRSGSFSVKAYSSGLLDGADIGTQTLFYPSNADPPFAGVVVVPGFGATESSIQGWGPYLASHGIVTLTIGTNTGGESPDVRAKALLEGVLAIKAENTRVGGPLRGQIAGDRFGIMGWSMGGGGALIAANAHPELKAVVTLAAWDPGAKFAMDQVPALLFAGSADNIAGGQSQGFYDSIPAPTLKILFEIQGGSHSVANDPSGAQGAVGRYGLSWLKVFLESDERYYQFLLQDPTQASSFKRSL